MIELSTKFGLKLTLTAKEALGGISPTSGVNLKKLSLNS